MFYRNTLNLNFNAVLLLDLPGALLIKAEEIKEMEKKVNSFGGEMEKSLLS